MTRRARRNRALKRGCGRPAAALDDTEVAERTGALDALQVAELLDRLREAAPREADVVALRFFGGLSEIAIGEVLGVSERTVRTDWTRARGRLAAWLGPAPGSHRV
jgi:RNA polymerase sigma factor (sigma-70 family)